MEFVQNNPFPMQQFQNQGYAFPEYDTKIITLFYGNSTGVTAPAGDDFPTNKYMTPAIEYTTYDNAGTPKTNTAPGGTVKTAKYKSDGTFEFILIEPIIIDKMADVFLDNFSILNGAFGATTEATKLRKYGAVLKIDQVNQNAYSNNTAINEGELLIFAKATTDPSKFIESKNKKFNYLGVMQPGRYGKITGKLVDLENAILTQELTGVSAVDGIAFSIDLVVSNKK